MRRAAGDVPEGRNIHCKVCHSCSCFKLANIDYHALLVDVVTFHAVKIVQVLHCLTMMNSDLPL